ncbi:MAG: hypothetical protein U5L74_10705 [Ideonella sp.]|nr:hypothetical protein [Ideonella sp.]
MILKTNKHTGRTPMHYLVIVGALFFAALVLPLQASLVLLLGFIVVTSIVRVSTKLVVDVDVTTGEAAKAVSIAFALLGVALFTLVSLSKGAGVQSFLGLSALAVLAALMLCYSLGFKMGLRIPLLPAMIVAGLSTVVSAVALYLLKVVMSAG